MMNRIEYHGMSTYPTNTEALAKHSFRRPESLEKSLELMTGGRMLGELAPVVDVGGKLDVDNCALLACFGELLATKDQDARTSLEKFGGEQYIRDQVVRLNKLVDKSENQSDNRNARLVVWYMQQAGLQVDSPIASDIPILQDWQNKLMHNALEQADTSPTMFRRGERFFYYLNLCVPESVGADETKYIRINRRNFAEGIYIDVGGLNIPDMFKVISEKLADKLIGVRGGIRLSNVGDDAVRLFSQSGQSLPVTSAKDLPSLMEELQSRVQKELTHIDQDNVKQLFGEIWGYLYTIQPGRDFNKRVAYLVAYKMLARKLKYKVPEFFLGEDDLGSGLLLMDRSDRLKPNPKELKLYGERLANMMTWVDISDFRSSILDRGFILKR